MGSSSLALIPAAAKLRALYYSFLPLPAEYQLVQCSLDVLFLQVGHVDLFNVTLSMERCVV